MLPLQRIGWRFFAKRHRSQGVLAVLGVALGVAIVIAIDLASGSALRSFERTVDSLSGRTTHHVLGGPGGVPDAAWAALRQAGVRSAVPVVEGTCRAVRDGQRREPLRLIGVDPLSEASVRPWLAAFGGDGARRRGVASFDVGRLLSEPNTVLMTARTAAALGVVAEGLFEIDAAGYRTTLRVIGILAPDDPVLRQGLDFALIADVATAQEVLRRVGRLSRIDLRLGLDAVDRVRELLEPPLRLRSSDRTRGSLDEMTRAFRQNLRALGLLALLVGAFLIFNTMQFAVVQRRELIGVVRAVGATPRQWFVAVLGEALVIATLGATLGVAIGVGLAQALLGLVGTTIQQLYRSVSIDGVDVQAATLWQSAGLGILIALLAAVVPALEATGVAARAAMSRQALEQRARGWLAKAVFGSVACGGLAAVALLWPRGGVGSAYAGVFFALLACACLALPLTAWLLRLAGPVLSRSFGERGRYAVRSAVGGLSRTTVAVAALMLAVAATVGVGAMVHSFRATVATWLDTTLAADVYVSVPQSMSTRTEAEIDPRLVAALRDLPGVSGLSTYRRVEVERADGSLFELAAIDPAPKTMASFRWLDHDPEAIGAAVHRGEGVVISEPLARRSGLGLGDRLDVRSDRVGVVQLPIVGVFRDYATERGWAYLARSRYDQLFSDPAVSSVAIWADEPAEAERLLDAVRQRVAAPDVGQELIARSNTALRTTSLAIFDQTFAVTSVLRLLCVIVAILGIGSALTALQLERRREIGILRAMGAVPAQIRSMMLVQNGLLGLCAGLLAIPTGALLAWLLVAVVHKRSFGWTLIEFGLPASVVLEALATAVVAATVAGIVPAWRMARAPVAPALRAEG